MLRLFLVTIILISTLSYSKSSEAAEFSGTCIHLFSKLETCTPYKCIHPHPDERKRKEEVYLDIKGKTEEGYCHFVQTTSLGDYLECKYTKESVDLWSKILQYYFRYGMFTINEEDERDFKRAFREECSTKPMEASEENIEEKIDSKEDIGTETKDDKN